MGDIKVMEVRKRKLASPIIDIDIKRTRFDNESLFSSDDTESILSIQGKETDVVRDTSDTSGSEYTHEIEIEYEIATSDASSDLFDGCSSSETEDILVTAGAIAAICETSLEAWATDYEESDTSSSTDSEFGPRDFTNCIQCKTRNSNPQYRYCEKCFQRCRKCNEGKNYKCFPLCSKCFKHKKSLLPPRPKQTRTRKRKQKKSRSRSVEIASCSVILSQDSGIGNESDKKGNSSQEIDTALPDSQELCIICNTNTKNSIFVHGRIAHMCCCYKCATRTWRTNKRCPMCNCKAQNILQVFTN